MRKQCIYRGGKGVERRRFGGLLGLERIRMSTREGDQGEDVEGVVRLFLQAPVRGHGGEGPPSCFVLVCWVRTGNKKWRGGGGIERMKWKEMKKKGRAGRPSTSH